MVILIVPPQLERQVQTFCFRAQLTAWRSAVRRSRVRCIAVLGGGPPSVLAEGQSRYNTSPDPKGHPFDLYDNRKDLGNTGPPDGAQFRGRGYVQLTGRANYATYGKSIGLKGQLIENPDLASEPAIAAKLLAAFLKNKERRIKEALLDWDFAGARRLVNGGSHGLDRFVDAYKTGIRLTA